MPRYRVTATGRRPVRFASLPAALGALRAFARLPGVREAVCHDDDLGARVASVHGRIRSRMGRPPLPESRRSRRSRRLDLGELLPPPVLTLGVA